MSSIARICIETDTKEILSFASKVEKARDEYTVVVTLTDNCLSSRINKRFLRHALFAEDCRVIGFFEDDDLAGLIVILKDAVSAVKSNGLAILIQPKQNKSLITNSIFDEEVEREMPDKIRFMTKTELPELVEGTEFVLDGVVTMQDSMNFYYSFYRKGGR